MKVMKTEKYIPTKEDIKHAEDNLTPEQKIQSEAHEEGFNLAREKGSENVEQFNTQPSMESFANFETAKANGLEMGVPEHGRFDKFDGVTPAIYLFRRTDGNYEVHLNPNRFISGRMEGSNFQGMFDFDPRKTDELYMSKIPAIINLNANGSFKVISKGEVVQL